MAHLAVELAPPLHLPRILAWAEPFLKKKSLHSEKNYGLNHKDDKKP